MAPADHHINSTSRQNILYRFTNLLLLFCLVVTAGCGRSDSSSETAFFSGNVRVSAEIDSTGDYSGFELAILNADTDQDLDTLGYAVTDGSGLFQMTVDASERGIYPIEIRRNDRVLFRDQFALAAGDSATVDVQFPMSRPMLVIRSFENGAWMAYRNTRALHNQRLADLSASETATLSDLRASILQGAEILWSLTESYPGTIGAELGRVEAIAMLEGWADSLVVERAGYIGADDAGYTSSLQALRRSTARLFGVQAAVDSLNRRLGETSDRDIQDAIQAEIVLTYLDSLQVGEARDAAEQLAARTRSETWESWATSAIFEMDNLMPGMVAPNASFTDLAGRDLNLNFFFDTTVLLEFIDPGDVRSVVNQSGRTDVLKLSDGTNFQVITVSLNRDRISNEIYLDNMTTSEAYIIPDEGVDSEIARTYNVQTVPKRFLIHDGKIAAKYSGTSMAGIRDDILSVINN